MIAVPDWAVVAELLLSQGQRLTLVVPFGAER